MGTSAIRLAVDSVAAFNGSNFVTSASAAKPAVREALEALAIAAGLPDSMVKAVSDTDLVSLYATARGRGGETACIQAADRIMRKYANALNPLLDPIARPGAVPTRAPEPAPLPGLPATDVRAIARDEVVKAFDPLAATLMNIAEKVNENLAGLPGQVDARVQAAIEALAPRHLNVSIGTGPVMPLGLTHRQAGDVIAMLAAGVNVYLHGPAGSGKTTVARQAAQAFNVPFYFAAKVESEYLLLGFTDAKGQAVRTPFRDAYERGGVFLLDEMDGSSPGAIVALNAALANGVCPFPDAVIERHPDFKCIGAGNTPLRGASRQYVGRNQLDAASVDRFAFLSFGYDEALEMAAAGNPQWVRYVQAVRRAVADRGLDGDVLVTPRASIDGAKLLAAGMSWEAASDAVLWKGLDPDTVQQITSALSPSLSAVA